MDVFITLVIGLVSLWKADLQWHINFQEKSLKITCALYAIETSLFALIRFYWGVSKPLVAAAAVHNLFEWSIVFHVAAIEDNDCDGKCAYKTFKKRLCWATLFIATLTTICLCIPSLYWSLALEMVSDLFLS